MVNYLLLLKDITHYSKKDIDQGYTPAKIYQICCSIKEAFCLSYSIRKENNLYLYFFEENVSIKLVGKNLRFLGSDERSQALLLNKAIKKIPNISLKKQKNWTESTPGFYVKKYKQFDDFISELRLVDFQSYIYIINDLEMEDDHIPSNIMPLKRLRQSTQNRENSLFILPTFGFTNLYSQNFILFKELEKIKFFHISNSNLSSDKILIINFTLDRNEMKE